MQPQLVIQDYGHHNRDLGKTIVRLEKSATWKKQRIVMVLPAGALMPTKAALGLRALIFPPNQPMVPIGALGAEVGEAYSSAIASILAHPELSQWEYLLTIEHDNIGPPSGVLDLIESMEAHPEYACIGGLYFTKGEGGVAQIWGDPNDPIQNFRPQVPRPGEVQECVGTGMGFNLWRLSMFKDERIPRPWFRTKASAAEGVGTQDLSFWSEARKHGYRCAIDCRVRVIHYDHVNDMSW